MKAILKSIAILAISVSISHADEYTGREKSETCLGCHAIEGYNNTPCMQMHQGCLTRISLI